MSARTYVVAAVGVTAAVELLGWFPRLERLGGEVAAVFGRPPARHTDVLLADTAVPSWLACSR